MSKEAMKAVDLSIKTKEILNDLTEHRGQFEYCSEVIAELTEDEAKGILRHHFYNTEKRKEKKMSMIISTKSEGIEVEGHVGTWYTIATKKVKGTDYYLLEHEEYGDDAAHVIVNSSGKLILEDVFNGFDDLEEHFECISDE